MAGLELEDDEALVGEIVPTPRAPVSIAERKLQDRSKLEALEDELYMENATILRDAARFSEISETATEPPEDWIQELGHAAAWKRFRMAKAAWSSAKYAPIGLALAKGVVVGMAKSRADQDDGRRQLNVQVVVLEQAPMPNYPRKRLEK